MLGTVAFIVYIFLNIIVIIFQICLAIGFPWGAASMGGKFPGVYPKDKRIIPIMSVIIVIGLILIGAIRNRFIFSNQFELSKILIWVVVAYFMIGTILNSITPSKIERIWAPVAGLQVICTIIIALH